MILVDDRGVQWHAHFQHFRTPRRTTVKLHDGPCIDAPCVVPAQWITTARCHPVDQFVKAKGRKVALTRAMAAMGLPKAARTALWRSYLRQTRVLRS